MSAAASSCPFCSLEGAVLRDPLAHARYDRFPVSAGHMLVIPMRHVGDFFSTTLEERDAMFALAEQARSPIEREHHPDGYNLLINVGEAAGQTLFHVHLHLIPRYTGDVLNPRGGVRGVIPSRQNY